MIKCASCEHYVLNDCKTIMHSGCGKYVHNPKGEIATESSEFTLCRGEELPLINQWSTDTYCIQGKFKHIWTIDRVTTGPKTYIASYKYYVKENEEFITGDIIVKNVFPFVTK